MGKVGPYQAWSEEEYQRLIQLLLHAQFKWILSEYLDPIYAPLTQRFGPPLEKVITKHGSLPVEGERPTYSEYFWSNYDIRDRLSPEGAMDANRLLEQLELRKRELDATIKTIKQELGVKTHYSTAPAPKSHHKQSAPSPVKRKGTMSAAGRKRIAAAQKLRWKKLKEAAAKK
jgi:hypothetical protein